MAQNPRDWAGDAKRLHVIVVADPNAADIGNSNSRDISRIINYFKDIFFDDRYPTLRDAITIRWHDRYPARADDILRLLSDPSIEPGDAIAFFYSGHGSFDRWAESQQLDLQPGHSLSLTEIRRTLFSRNQRFAAVFINACNVFTESLTLPPAGAQAADKEDTRNHRLDIVRDLFFRPMGYVEFRAAKPGEIAWGQEQLGSFFLTSLFGNLRYATYGQLDENGDEWITWREVEKHVVKVTASVFREARSVVSKSVLTHPMLTQSMQTPNLVFAPDIPVPLSKSVMLYHHISTLEKSHTGVPNIVRVKAFIAVERKDRPFTGSWYFRKSTGRYVKDLYKKDLVFFEKYNSQANVGVFILDKEVWLSRLTDFHGTVTPVLSLRDAATQESLGSYNLPQVSAP